MSLSVAKHSRKWSVRPVINEDIPLAVSWYIKTHGENKEAIALQMEVFMLELISGDAVMVLNGVQPKCWVGCSGGQGGQGTTYYLTLTVDSDLRTRVITPLVNLWRAILDHFFIKGQAELIRVNLKAAYKDQIDLLKNMGFRNAPPARGIPSYVFDDQVARGPFIPPFEFHSDPAPALTCTRQDYLDRRDRKYP